MPNPLNPHAPGTGQPLATVSLTGTEHRLRLPASLWAFGVQVGEPVIAFDDVGNVIPGEITREADGAPGVALLHAVDPEARWATVRRPRSPRAAHALVGAA